MDFRNLDSIFSGSSGTTYETGLLSKSKETLTGFKEKNNMAARMELADSNKDLIDLCVATKSDSYLSYEEMFKYGVLALNMAAIDATEEDNFRIFARRRIELMLNKAIAEAYMLREIAGKFCDNDKLGMEFTFIEETFRHN